MEEWIISWPPDHQGRPAAGRPAFAGKRLGLRPACCLACFFADTKNVPVPRRTLPDRPGFSPAFSRGFSPALDGSPKNDENGPFTALRQRKRSDNGGF